MNRVLEKKPANLKMDLNEEVVEPWQSLDGVGGGSMNDNCETICWRSPSDGCPRESSDCHEDASSECIVDPCVTQVALSVDRLVSTFNLGVRYWDKNMPVVALREVRSNLPEMLHS